MVQHFYVVRCCSCGSCQVHIERKDGKFCCKMCGLKQSVRKVYGKGSARDCRLHVQKLNNFIASKNSAEEAHLIRDTFDTAASKHPSDERVNNEIEWLEGNQNSVSQAGVYLPSTSHSNSVIEERFSGISGRQSVRFCLGDELDRKTGDQVSRSTEVMEKPFQGFPDLSFYERDDEERVYENQESSLFYDQISGAIERNDESCMDFKQLGQDFNIFDSHRGVKSELGEGSSVQSLPGPSGIRKLEMGANELYTRKTTRKAESLANEYVSNDDFCCPAASEEPIEDTYKLKSSSGDPLSVIALSSDHWKERISHELGENSPVGRSKPFAEDEDEVFAKQVKYAPTCPSASSHIEVTVGRSKPLAEDEHEVLAKKGISATRGRSVSSHAEVKQNGDGLAVTVKNGSDCTVHGQPTKTTLYSKYSKCDDLDDLTF